MIAMRRLIARLRAKGNTPAPEKHYFNAVVLPFKRTAPYKYTVLDAGQPSYRNLDHQT